jgi:hypothetical protein
MSELLEQAIAKLKTCSISKQNEIAAMILKEIQRLERKTQSIETVVESIDLDESPEIDLTATTPMQHAGILETDPTFDDWTDKLAEIRRSANEINNDERLY